MDTLRAHVNLLARVRPRASDPTARPFMTTVIIWQVVAGVALIVDAIVPWWRASVILAETSPATAAIGVMLLTGAVLVLFGLAPRRSASRSWTAEVVGHFLLAGATATYAQVAIFAVPHAVFNWSWPLALVMASLLRAWQVIRQDRTARREPCTRGGAWTWKR